MARLTAPLLSLDARGQIGEAIVFSGWKGIKYARQYVIPANPQTTAQQEVRGVFSTLSEIWKRLPVTGRAPFIYAARGNPLTPRNVHVRESVAALIDQATLDEYVMSVSGGQAVPLTAMTPADAGGQVIELTCTIPSIPIGYTLQAVVGAAMLDGDPSPVIERTTIVAIDAAAPYVVSLDVGVAGNYQVGAWCSFTRDSDSLPFTSAALRDQQVVA